MLEISGVSKKIGTQDILKDVSFSVTAGSIFGLIGPNGAGKTSLIKMIAGIWRQDNGHIKINGTDVFDCNKVKETMGYIPDGSHYYNSFKLNEIIKFHQLAYKNFNLKKLEELNSIFQLPLSRKVSALSKGMKTKLSFMLGLSIKPKLLVMDEPTSGLDPIAKGQLIDIILDEAAQNGTTILMSTHNLSDVEKICDNIAVIDKGRIKYTGTVDDLKRNARKIQAVFPSRMPQEVLDHPDILDIKSAGSIHYIFVRNYSKEFHKYMISKGAVLAEETGLSLEEIFIYLLGGGKSNE